MMCVYKSPDDTKKTIDCNIMSSCWYNNSKKSRFLSKLLSLPCETEIDEAINLLCGFIIVEVSELGDLNHRKFTLLFLMMSSSSSEPSSSSTSGLSGGFSSHLLSLFQSTEPKKECYFIAFQFLAPKRFLGSRSNRPQMRFFAASLTFFGNFSLPSLMFL